MGQKRIHTYAKTSDCAPQGCFPRVVPSDSRQDRRSKGLSIAAFIAACMLALVVCFGGLNAQPYSAYAEIYPANEAASDNPAAAQDPQASASSADANDDSEENGEAEGESIEDEETPMSSGLGGGEPVASGFSFGPIAVAGIVAVVAFFLVLFRKLNGSISRMNSMFK